MSLLMGATLGSNLKDEYIESIPLGEESLKTDSHTCNCYNRAFSPYHQDPIFSLVSNPKYCPFFPNF